MGLLSRLPRIQDTTGSDQSKAVQVKKIYYVKFETSIESFHWDIEVVFTSDVDEYWKFISPISLSKATAFHFQPEDENKSILVFPWSCTYGQVAHEAYHLVVAMAKHVEMKSWDEEFVAYHVEYVVDEVVNFVCDRKKKRKKWIIPKPQKAK